MIFRILFFYQQYRRIVLCCGLLCWASSEVMALPADGYAATVNDQVITVGEVIALAAPLEKQLRLSYHGTELNEKLEEVYQHALDSLIERALILDAFNQRKDLALPEASVNLRVEEIIRNRFGNSRTAFQKALAEEGLTLDELKKNLRVSQIVTLMREMEVERKVFIAPQAVYEAYQKEIDKYRIPAQAAVRMIMIHGGKNTAESEIKLKLATDIHQRLLAGENFNELARQITEGPKAEEGGYLGWIDPTTRHAELANAITSMKVGAISDVIKVDNNFYIIKLEGRTDSETIPFAKVETDLRAQLTKQEIQRRYEAWVARLKKDALIKKY